MRNKVKILMLPNKYVFWYVWYVLWYVVAFLSVDGQKFKKFK